LPPISAAGAALASGALLAAAFPPLSCWPAAFAAVAILVAASRRSHPAAGALTGWLAGLAFHVLAFTWVPGSIARLQTVDFVAALPAFALFAAWQAVPFAVVGACIAALPALSPLGAAAVAGGWVVVEAIFPRILPWHLGDVLAPVASLLQIAEIGGVRLPGFVVVFTAACLAAAFKAPPGGARRRAMLGGFGALSITAAFGLWRDPGSTVHDSSDSVSVMIVQAGTSAGNPVSVDVHNQAAWDTHVAATRAALGDGDDPPDLVVWPETVLRVPVLRKPTWRRRIDALSAELDAPLLVGVLDRDRTGVAEHNAALLVDPFVRRPSAPGSGPPPRRSQLYHKQMLLPFGEYVPGPQGVLPQWRTTGGFVAGEAASPLQLMLRESSAPVPLGTSICFEAMLPGFFNDAVSEGARLLVNLTDDGWFGAGAEPEQHLNATRLRAVETRRWMLRASGSGVSALVSPSGDVVDRREWGEMGVLVRQVGLYDGTTVYVRTGDIPWLLAAGLLAVLPFIRRGSA
jgi:apolipoprotein N-acyltransferase